MIFTKRKKKSFEHVARPGCDQGNAELVKFLLDDCGADPNRFCVSNPFPPLVLAAYHGYYRVLEAFKTSRVVVPVSFTGLAKNSYYFCFLFVKIIDLPGGQINDPLLGKHHSLPFLPATPSSPSWALDSLCALLPELQRYKDSVRCATLGAEVPGHRQQQIDANLVQICPKYTFLTHQSLIVSE